jgi:hypothetical protein
VKPQLRLLLGLVLSLVAHGLLWFIPLWEAAEPPEAALRIQLVQPAITPAPAAAPAVPGRGHGGGGNKPSKRGKVKEVAPVATTSAPEVVESALPAQGPSGGLMINEPLYVDGEEDPARSAPAGEPDGKTPSPPQEVVHPLPRSGRVSYVGTASFLNVTGLVSWQHDGVRYDARLGAGVLGATSSFDYTSSGRFVAQQVVTESTRDNRRGKLSVAQIDNEAGVVRMERGGDVRERRITGLAVALSSLPQALASLDWSAEKVSLFVVGDFWVEDAVVIDRGLETLQLPALRLEARRFQAKINNGKTLDIWLAPVWRNAPARIRYDDGSLVVDLKASEVEIDGERLLSAQSPGGE